MRRFLLVVLFLSMTLPVWAEADKTKALTLTHISLNALDADWWADLDTLSGVDKQAQLLSIEKDILRDVEALPEGKIGESATTVQQLIKQLSKQYITPQPSYKKRSNIPPNTLENWLVFFNQSHQTNREVGLLKEDLARLKLLNKERSKDIAKDLVDYRLLQAGSDERIIVAMNVLRLQLEQLLSSERLVHLKKKLIHLKEVYKTQHMLLEDTIMQLKPDPDLRQVWQQQHNDLLLSINASSRTLYSLELEGLGRERDTLPLDGRVEVLLLSAKLASQTIALAQLELKVAIDRALQGDSLVLPPAQKESWEQWNDEKAQLYLQFNDLFQTLGSNNDGASSTNRAPMWTTLQEARQHIQEGEIKGREVEQLLNAYDVISSERQGRFGVGLSQLTSWGGALVETGGEIMDYPLFLINESPITPKDLTWVLIVIMIAALISSSSRKALIRFGESKKSISESALFTMGRILHYVIIVAALLIGFSTLGIDLSKLALVAGALSVGIGFGLQSIFNNFISGLILLFERPLKVGDLIELESGVRGRIRSINVRSTQVATWDNIDILVPNSEFISGRVTNYTFSDDSRRLHIGFGVAYGSDKELVRRVVLEASEKVPHTFTNNEYKTDVWLVNYGESSLDFELVVWVKSNSLPKRSNPKAIYLWEIETALSHHGIEIPFPQRDLHVRSVDNKILSSRNAFDNVDEKA